MHFANLDKQRSVANSRDDATDSAPCLLVSGEIVGVGGAWWCPEHGGISCGAGREVEGHRARGG
eukprot:SAG11_NODE_37142_length_258_cov_0.654088_1_plen_63_part_01